MEEVAVYNDRRLLLTVSPSAYFASNRLSWSQSSRLSMDNIIHGLSDRRYCAKRRAPTKLAPPFGAHRLFFSEAALQHARMLSM